MAEKNNNNSAKDKVLKYILLILLPFLLLGLIEFSLRIIHYGTEYPLFIPAKNFPDYIQPNPEIIKRYFPPGAPVPDVSPDTQYIKKIKPENEFRIVIQGGSTAAGFPFGRFGSLKGMLDERFKRLYPDKNIEIINTAMSAVNSYTLLDFTDEIIALKPDLILIYAGHNEFLGIMGVGSTFASKGGRLATLLSLKLKNFRIFQLLQKLIYGINKQPEKKFSTKRTLMARIAKEKDIPLSSPLYHSGVNQFQKNLNDILNQYQQHHIPVILGTLVSNEKDQPPFASSSSTDVNKSADLAYLTAQKMFQKGYNKQARKMFQLARDLDLLRFRAPTGFNKIIQTEAKIHHAYIADVESTFVKHSPEQIPDSTLILEHLHPNLKGYFYLAKAFSDAIIINRLLPEPIKSTPGNFNFQDIPVSKSDRLYGLYKIKRLKSGYPFTTHPISVPMPQDNSLESIALRKRIKGEPWLAIQQKLLTEYQKQNDFKEAAKIAARITDAIPEQHQSAYIAAQLYSKVNDIDMAIYYHKKALLIKPDYIPYLFSLAQDYYKKKDFITSLSTLQRILRLNSNNKTAKYYIQMIKQQQKGLLH